MPESVWTSPAYGLDGSRSSAAHQPAATSKMSSTAAQKTGSTQASAWNGGTCHWVFLAVRLQRSGRESRKFPQPRGGIPIPMAGAE
jgi:hypothetical protein